MKVLITGISGFIGRHLNSRLKELDYEVIGLNSQEGNILDNNTFKALEHQNVQHVCHLAGKTFVPLSWNDPSGFYEANLLGTLNVLEFCRKNGISLTYISSYIYGQPKRLPVPEDHTISPGNPYAHSKYMAEQLCEFYANVFKIRVCILRPFNVYGTGQDEKFLVPYIVKQAMYSDQIKVKDLEPKRDYVYIDDLVEAITLTIKNNRNFSIYNIGSGYSVSVRQIIELVQRILNTKLPVSSENETRQNEINDVVADISRAKRELGWKPEHSIEEGLKKVIHFEMRDFHDTKGYTHQQG